MGTGQLRERAASRGVGAKSSTARPGNSTRSTGRPENGLRTSACGSWLSSLYVFQAVVWLLTVPFACISIVFRKLAGKVAGRCDAVLSECLTSRYSAWTPTQPVRPKTPLVDDNGDMVPSINFMGGGQLWMFSIGVAHYLRENYDLSNVKYTASSCGTFGALPLACGLDPYDWCAADWGKCIDYFSSGFLFSKFGLGCVMGSKHFYYGLWDAYLPHDAHIRCSGRLFLSVTQWPSLKNRLVSEFETRDQLIWTAVASVCLPMAFIGDFPVDVPGVGPCIDGGFSDDAPVVDSNTLSASALHNKADISPRILADDEFGPGYWENPLTLLDIVVTPQYDRVWQIGAVGQAAAKKSEGLKRPEWAKIRKTSLE